MYLESNSTVDADRDVTVASTSVTIVYSGMQEPAEHYWEQLRDAGLTMAPLERG